MRWPWTRDQDEQEAENKRVEDTRVSMHQLIGRLEQVVDKLERTLEERNKGERAHSGC